jgi:hypothetical protein
LSQKFQRRFRGEKKKKKERKDKGWVVRTEAKGGSLNWAEGKIREGRGEVHGNRNRNIDYGFHYSVLLMVIVMVKPSRRWNQKEKKMRRKILFKPTFSDAMDKGNPEVRGSKYICKRRGISDRWTDLSCCVLCGSSDEQGMVR